MDRDFDGRLSFEEFMGEESPIEKLFKNMDKNGDGLVTKQVDASIIKIINLKLKINKEFLKIFYVKSKIIVKIKSFDEEISSNLKTFLHVKYWLWKVSGFNKT